MRNLLFFNQYGYPYNFEYDEVTEKFTGKILFEENSSDTFKTNPLYVFEEVNSFDFDCDFRMKNIQDYNYSGITYVAKTYENEFITDIQKVNNNASFYSKWIYGDNFDDKFPKGSVVSFSGMTAYSYFDNQYFTVLDNKPDAILITGAISNSGFTTYYITGGTISSHNFFIKTDYDSDLVSKYIDFELEENKKLSIVGSEYNDGVYTLVKSGQCYVQRDVFEISGETGDTLKLQITLLTERPSVYSGPITLNITSDADTGTTIKFHNGLNTMLSEGQKIIFEDFNDADILTPNPIFTITNIIDEENIATKDLYITKKLNEDKTLFNNFNSRYPYDINYNIDLTQNFLLDQLPETYKYYDNFIEYTGSTATLKKDDIIKLYANFTGQTLNNNREFKILEVTERTIQDMRIDYWKDYILNNELELLKEDASLKNIHLDVALEKRAKDYFIQNDSMTLKASYPTTLLRVEQYVINDYENNYDIKKQLQVVDTLYCSQTTYASTQSYSGNSVGYLATNVIELEQTFLTSSASTSYEDTIKSFINKHINYLHKFGIDVYTLDNENIVVESFYNIRNTGDIYYIPDIFVNDVSGFTVSSTPVNRVYLELKEQLISNRTMPYDGTELSYPFLNETLFNLYDDNNTYGFNININGANFYQEFYNDRTGYTYRNQQTINNFIDSYDTTLNNLGFNVYSGYTSSGYTLIVEAINPDIYVNNFDVTVNKFSSYSTVREYNSVLETIVGNELIVSGNTGSCSLTDLDLATGMIILVSGSNYAQNNGEFNIIELHSNKMGLSYQGAFFNDRDVLNIYVNEYLRTPRESYNKDVYYNFKWDEEYEYHTDSMFFYDLSGDQLEYPINYDYNENIKYTGVKPLYNSGVCWDISYLNKNHNTSYLKTTSPKYQKTVFDNIKILLDRKDSQNISFVPKPLQVFMGYNSKYEGVDNNILIVEKIEDVKFSGFTTSVNSSTLSEFTMTTDGKLNYFTNNITFDFVNLGFETGQLIEIKFVDQTSTGETIFENYETYKIDEVGKKYIKVDLDSAVNDIVHFVSSASTDGYEFSIDVQPKTILECNVYGETEIEDERFDINLRNLGIDLDKTIESIFYESDIKEEGIDYRLLNDKRKEMLMNYKEIYDYIGSYKAIINAVNFFGFDDLELYEYYRNVNVNSPMYQKLSRVKIPDIFDQSVEGWTEQNYIQESSKRKDYKKTNLFNLVYRITDEDGNNVNTYSLNEVQTKLTRMKQWMIDKGIIPLSSNILDVTGIAETPAPMYVYHDSSNQVKKTYIERTGTAVNFNYQQTLSFGSNYLVTVDFYTNNDFVPSGWTCKVKTYSLSGGTSNILVPQQYLKFYKIDLSSLSFNVDFNVDPYIYIETMYYDDGVGQMVNKMFDATTTKNYLLINNNFTVPSKSAKKYITTDDIGWYFYNEDGYITLYN